MSGELTEHAIRTIEGLSSSWFINWILRGSIHDPALGGSEHHQNWRVFGAMEWYLSERQISHAGDSLNTYCQLILAEILQRSEPAWDEVKSVLQKTGSKTREKAGAFNLLGNSGKRS